MDAFSFYIGPRGNLCAHVKAPITLNGLELVPGDEIVFTVTGISRHQMVSDGARA